MDQKPNDEECDHVHPVCPSDPVEYENRQLLGAKTLFCTLTLHLLIISLPYFIVSG